MIRLPVPGSDSGQWGAILNAFLSVEHDSDGQLRLRSDGTLDDFYVKPASGVPPSDLAGSIPATLFATSVQTQLAQAATAYQKPPGGIPATDLTASVQTALSNTAGAVQIGGDLGGNPAAPTIAKIQGQTVDASTPADGQVLAYDGANKQWVPGTVTSTTVNDATTSGKGIVQLSGDLGGTASAPVVLGLQGVAITGTPSSGQALVASSATGAAWSALPSAPVASVNGRTGAITLTATDVGLGNVNNTADVDKPISNATQAALDQKATAAASVAMAIAL